MQHASPVIQFVVTALAILSLASVTLLLSKRLHLPFAVCLVIAGFCGAQLTEHVPQIFGILSDLSVSHDLIFFVLMPTLVFESAYGLNAWHLRRNWLPIITLAIPGMVLSTLLIGLLVTWLTPLPLLPSLLLGSVLSAIDHVSVSSVFKQMGAPKRLIILVEGESLFSDVTLIVLAYALLDAVKADFVTGSMSITLIFHFFKVLLGGIAIGLVCGYTTGLVLGKVTNNPLFEISLVMMLAYVSFLIAEYGFHVSGVMATAVTGLMMSGWGQTKISHSVHQYLDEIWEFLTFISVAMIFLLVGYFIDVGQLLAVMPILFRVILTVLLARAVVVFGLLPLIGKLPSSEPIDWRFQVAMYWGGIRGAVAMALMMSLGEFEYRNEFLALATGVVIFTLVGPGLTLRPLMRILGLDKPTLDERFVQAESLLSAKQHALACVPDLRAGGLFSARIAKELEGIYQNGIEQSRQGVEQLRYHELNADKEITLLFFRCLSEEKTFYFDMYSHAHISEQAYRQLSYGIDLQSDSLRYNNRLPVDPPKTRLKKMGARMKQRLADTRMIGTVVERFRANKTALDYELIWGRYQASLHILNNLEKMDKYSSRPETLDQVRNQYQRWNGSAKQRFDQMAEQFPEFVNAMQLRLAERLLLHAERQSIAEKKKKGTISVPVATKMLERLDHEINHLRGLEAGKLKIASSELLKKIPFFQNLSEDDFHCISQLLHSVTFPAGSIIFNQGDSGQAMYLIARGVIRVSVCNNGTEVDVATMIAGDFFGEMALLHNTPRTATCKTVTPCALYKLNGKDFDRIKSNCPSIETVLNEADKKRLEELQLIKS